MPPKKKMSPAPLPPPSLREELGIPPSVTDTEMQDLLRPPLVEMPMPEYTFGSQNIGPTAIRAGAGIVGGILQGVGGPLGTLGSMATNTIGEDLAQRAEVYTGIRDEPDLGRVGTAGLMGAIPFPALRTATPLVREAGQAAFNTALPVGMVAAENAIEGRPQSAEELMTAGGAGLLTHGAFKGAGVGIGTLLSRGHVRPQVAIEGFPMEQALGPEAGAAVYHGTPHTWPPEPEYPIGRPTLEKVRTGTGGMAQGHGFYVAQSPKVGEYYQNLGKTLSINDVAYLKQEISNLKEQLTAWEAKKPYTFDAEANIENTLRNRLKLREEELNQSSGGNLYTLDLPDEHLDKMLDWDKPISQQPEPVQKVAQELGYKETPPDEEMAFHTYKDWGTGHGFYSWLSRQMGGDDKASQYLLSKGIIGNKYLDAMSRPNNVIEQRMIDTLQRHQGNKEAALEEFMSTVHNTPKEKAKMRKEFTEIFDRLANPKHNLVLFDPSLATPIARNNEPVPLSTLTGTKEDLTPNFNRFDPNAPEGPFAAPMKEWPTHRVMESPGFPDVQPIPSRKSPIESLPARPRLPRKSRSSP